MAIDLDRITGPDVTIQIDLGAGLIGFITYQNLSFAFAANEINADAADTRITEGVLPKSRLTVTGSVWVNVDNTPATVPLMYDKITDLTAKVGADTVIPDISDYLPLTVTENTFNIELAPEACNFTAVSGIKNP